MWCFGWPYRQGLESEKNRGRFMVKGSHAPQSCGPFIDIWKRCCRASANNELELFVSIDKTIFKQSPLVFFTLPIARSRKTFTERKAIWGLIRMVDTKVLSIIRSWKKGAIISVDNLETSIISNAPFAVGFLEVILNILKEPECSFSDKFFQHDQIQTEQGHYLHPKPNEKGSAISDPAYLNYLS